MALPDSIRCRHCGRRSAVGPYTTPATKRYCSASCREAARKARRRRQGKEKPSAAARARRVPTGQPGVYLRNGRYIASWNDADGRRRSRGFATLEEAVELREEKRRARRPEEARAQLARERSVAARVADAYASVRRAAGLLDGARAEMGRASRRSADEALAGLYRAEDALTGLVL